jgi:hypothetical protein
MLTRREGLRVTIAALVLGTVTMVRPAWAQEAGQLGVPRLALRGYDPVAYFTEGYPVQGKPEFEFTWDEARYRFASDEHLSMFRGDPDRYAPQFAGSCTIGMSKGMKVEADPENWIISDDRLFVFRPSDGPVRFQADAQNIAAAADRNWERLKKAPMADIPQ